MTKVQRLKATLARMEKAAAVADRRSSKAYGAWWKEKCRIARVIEIKKRAIANKREKIKAAKLIAARQERQLAKHVELMKTPWYKWTTSDGKGIYQGEFQYNLPTVSGPGKPHVTHEVPVACHNGLHAVKPAHMMKWYTEYRRLFEVSVGGKYDHSDSEKSSFTRMTFVREIIKGSDQWFKLTGRTN